MSTGRDDVESYDECMSKAERRYASGSLRLCPHGYCTAKRKYAVYPSAYANGYATQVCRGTQPNEVGVRAADPRYVVRGSGGTERASRRGGLERWYAEEWVNVCERGEGPGGYAPCGSGAGVGDPARYPYCRPYHRLPGTRMVTAGELTAEERALMCRRKRALPQGVLGKPTNVRLPSATLARVKSARAAVAATRGGRRRSPSKKKRAVARGRRTRSTKNKKRSQRGGRGEEEAGGAAFPWLSLAEVESHVPEAARLGVSTVAREAPRGFVAAYRRHRTPRAMGRAAVPGRPRETWSRRRANFIKRHLPQYEAHPTTRRRLALRMWAYEPAANRGSRSGPSRPYLRMSRA